MAVGLHSVNLANKLCSACVAEKPADQFAPQRRQCIDCVRAKARQKARDARQRDPEAHRQYLRDYRAREPERHRQYAAVKHLAKKGLTPQEFRELLERQGGGCAVCQAPEPGGKGRWHVDHDHRCPICGPKQSCHACTRGLLCFNCNIALGYLGDDPARLLAAADYLMNVEVKTWQ